MFGALKENSHLELFLVSVLSPLKKNHKQNMGAGGVWEGEADYFSSLQQVFLR